MKVRALLSELWGVANSEASSNESSRLLQSGLTMMTFASNQANPEDPEYDFHLDLAKSIFNNSNRDIQIKSWLAKRTSFYPNANVIAVGINARCVVLDG